MRLMIAAFTLLVSLNLSAQTVWPESGMWWNPDRSGHGMDINRAGNDMILVWYTYELDGTPTWYVAAGAYSGNSWTEALRRYTLSANKLATDNEIVGEVTLGIEDTGHFNFDWTLNYDSGTQTGSEPMVKLDVTYSIPTENYSGHWFNPADPGWGLTVVNQGDTEFEVLYFYDGAGQPRWALGNTSIAEKSFSDSLTIDMYTYTGFSPGADAISISDSETKVGSVTRSFSSPQTGKFDASLVLSNGISGTWDSTDTDLQMISDATSTDELYAESVNQFLENINGFTNLNEFLVLFEELGLFNGGALKCPTVTGNTIGLLQGTITTTQIIADYGEDGCINASGDLMQGRYLLDFVEFLLSPEEISGTIITTAEEVLRNGALFANGVQTVVTDMTVAESELNGEISLDYDNFLLDGMRIDGELTGTMEGLDLEEEEDLSALFERASLTMDNLRYGSNTISGEVISEMLETQGNELYRNLTAFDLQTSEGPVNMSLLFRQPSEFEFVMSTTETGQFGDATIRINNLTWDELLCEVYPISGSYTLGYAGQALTWTFDGSCSEPIPG